MSERDSDDLWTRFLNSEISSKDEAELERSLSSDEALRKRALDDAELDGMLGALGRIESTDEFVSKFSARLDEVHDEIPVFPSRTTKVEAPIPPDPHSRSVKPPPIPPPMAELPTRGETNPVRPPINQPVGPIANPTHLSSVSRDERQRSSVARSRQRSTLAITAAVLLIAATVTVVIVVANLEGQPIAKEPARQQPGNTKTPSVSPRRNSPNVTERRDTDNLVDGKTPAPILPDRSDSIPPKPEPVIPPTPQNNDPENIVKSDIPQSKVPDLPIPIGPEDASQIVARLTKTTDAIWDIEPETELTSKRLLLREGSAQVVLNDGAIVTVQGPAEFQIDSAGSILLVNGRLSATVNEEAVGFTVQTPSTRVVDLGTQFDVSVDGDGATAIRCHRGKVQLTSTPAGGAKGRKWQLGEGQFKWLARDGSSHDWHLMMNIDGTGRGSINVNGLDFPIGGLRDFVKAQRKVLNEFTTFQRDFVTRARRGDKFSGIVNVNGQTVGFDDRASFANVRRRTTQHLDLLNDLMRRLESVRGSFNVNGVNFRFNNMQELLKAQQEMMKRFGAAANNLRGAMNLGDKSLNFGNFQDLLKGQQDMFRGFGGGGFGGDGVNQLQDVFKIQQDMFNQMRRGGGAGVVPGFGAAGFGIAPGAGRPNIGFGSVPGASGFGIAPGSGNAGTKLIETENRQ